MRQLTIVLIALTLGGAVPSASRQSADARQTPDLQAQRLATLGRVWLAVKFAHPRVALTDRDWDAVLTSALPAVRAATDDRAFEGAVAAMLLTLDDPATRIVPSADISRRPVAPGPARPPSFTELSSGTLLVDLRAPGSLNDPAMTREAIAGHLGIVSRAGRVIVDVRGAQPLTPEAFDPLYDILVSAPTPLPATRVVRHSGYRAQAGGAPFYSSELTTTAAAVVTPREGMTPRRVTFVVDGASAVPPIALALRATGTAAILAVGAVPLSPVRVTPVRLGGAMALIRVGDLTVGGRRVEIGADETMAREDTDERVHARAAALVVSTRTPVAAIDDPQPTWTPDAPYADAPYPTESRRLLAVYRLWGVLDAFNPYRHLLDRPWDDVLAEFIPRVLDARDELEYARALAQMAALAQDTHVRLTGSSALARFLGEVTPAVSVRSIENRFVVTRIVDPQAAPGAAVGDEILLVDGEEVMARAARLEQHMAFSTPASRNSIVAARLLAGAPGLVARVTVRSAGGGSREVEVRRPAKPVVIPQRTGDVSRILDGNIGYADLERLEVAEVGPLFDRFRDTAGIIFDMRGYPRGTAWSIAPRINTRKATAAALFYRPIMTAGSTFERLSFVQDLPPTSTWVYERPTVLLIDERTISQAEHSALFYKAANSTTFVGSPTTGANGDVTSLVLPGGLRVSFTGHDVRWPDGRQLQRIGLIPDVPIAPTIAGIRAGRDEVLEAALAFLQKAKN
jgi:C-terminal processing protease CtpA/Prc